MNKYERICKTSEKLGEENDCSVKALAIAGGVTYQKARAALRKHGRKKGEGAYNSQINNAAHSLGIRTIRSWPRTINDRMYTAKSITKVYPKGSYILSYSGHVAAMVNGEVMDWTTGKGHKVMSVIKYS